MFRPDDVKERLRQEPFVPLRIVTTTGQTYDVHHPDLVWVGRTRIMVGTPSPDAPDIFDRTTRVALVHVTEMQDLPPVTKPGANGTHG